MASGFEELHDELRAVARDLLGKHVGAPVDPALLVSSGWLGLEVPDALDGAGATFAEVAVVLAEEGRAVATSPYFGTAVLGVGALLLAEPGPVRDDLLRAVAEGTRSVTTALATGDEPGTPFTLAPDAGRVHGVAPFVPDAPGADTILLLAADPEPVLVCVTPDAAGLAVTPQPVLDATRHLGVVTADGVEAATVLRFADPGRAVARLADRAALAVALDGLGLAEAMLDATVAYAKAREQFDRPIGSFQAVKHACADMLVDVTITRELCDAAVEALAHDADDAPTRVAMAAAHAGEAAVRVVGAAMQLHGGIGYTWESGVHTFFKRAALDRSLFGSPAAHRRRIAARYRD